MNKWSTKKNGTGVWRKKVFICLEGGWNLQYSSSLNKFVSGCFEDPVYFDEIREIRLAEFTPKKDLLQKNREMMWNIQ